MITTENESFSKIILNWLKKESSLALKKPVKFRKNLDKYTKNFVIINPKDHLFIVTTENEFLDKFSEKGYVCLYPIDLSSLPLSSLSECLCYCFYNPNNFNPWNYRWQRKYC